MDRVQRYNEHCSALFEYWKQKQAFGQIDHANNIFISDGVVCPEIWFSQEIRPLFLLKEAYGWHNDGDLIKDHLLTQGSMSGYPTWRRVTQWAEGLLKTTAEAIYPYTKQKNCTFGNEFLKHIAAVNIKKSGGVEKSNADDLMAYAKHDKDELYEQIQIIDPTVIICGYTMEYLNIIMPEPIKEWAGQSQNLFYRTQLNGHDVLVLDYWHPSNQYPDIMNYYTLMGIYQQALISSQGR